MNAEHTTEDMMKDLVNDDRGRLIDEGRHEDEGIEALLMAAAPRVAADVLIQAGHEGRTRGATGAEGPLGREIDWTPIVADEATRVLREAGVSVIRAGAALRGEYRVKIAVFIHFDGSDDGGSGASIGYDDPSDIPAADAWRELYGRYWPYRWMRDNFTGNLRGYYGFRFTTTSDAELVLELGDINDLRQARWLRPRLTWIGALLAHFIALRIGREDIPLPGEIDEGPEP